MVAGARFSGTFDTKAAALAWEAEQGINAGGKKTVVNTKTCADAFRKYELEVSKLKRGHRWEAFRLAFFAEMPLGSIMMYDLDATHIATWRDERLMSVQGGAVTREMNLRTYSPSLAKSGNR